MLNICGFVKSYNEKKRDTNPNEVIMTLSQKKRGRSTLLPEEVGAKVMEMTSSMRLSGAVVNNNVLIAIAKGLVIANDRTLLAEFGGTIELGWKWCTSVFKRMNWVNRKCTTSKPTTFFKEISEVVQERTIFHHN